MKTLSAFGLVLSLLCSAVLIMVHMHIHYMKTEKIFRTDLAGQADQSALCRYTLCSVFLSGSSKVLELYVQGSPR